jgi:subtilisin family serine protease
MRRLLIMLSAFAVTLALVPAAGASTATPSDEHFGLQWGLQQVNAPQAWATATGAGQRIAIVDSGVDLSHPDLRGKIAGGATFVDCGPGQQSCGNGDWDGGDPHGTHVAGIAAAATDNGIGIAGAAPDAEILAVRVLDDEGSGSFEDIAAGIRWAADNGADVINLSLGALPGIQALEITGLISDATDAIDYAVSRGVVVIAAAGNEFFPLCGSPSWNAGALCVIATDRFEQKASYSNFLTDEAMNVVAAPGGAAFLTCEDDIISTWPSGEEGFCSDTVGTPGYEFLAGTSMAAPHVAGVAALLTEQGLSVAQVYDVLRSTARTPVLGLRGTYTPTHGWGIVDAEAALTAAGGTAPDPVEPGDGGDDEDGGNGRNGQCRGNGKKSC